MNKWRKGASLAASALLVISCLASCQAVFTFSPLSFLQRDPSSMGPAQQLEFANQALASGDTTAMQSAYTALALAAAAAPNDPDIQYTAAQLALSLSGVGDVFTSLMSSLGEGGAELDLSIPEDLDIDLDLLVDAAGYLDAADAAGADLSASDYLAGAVGLVIAGASDPEDILGTLDDNPNLDRAEDFLGLALDELPEDDPVRDMLQSLLDSLGGGGAA